MASVSASLVLFGGLILLTILPRIIYAGQALPGINALGQSLAGMDRKEIISTLEGVLSYTEEGLIVFYDDDDLWTSRPGELGVSIDASTMAERALSLGRQGNFLQRITLQWEAWFTGRQISPVVIFDQNQAGRYLSQLAEVINRPQIEATLDVEGISVDMHPGQIGRKLNIDATLALLQEPVAKLHDAQIDLVIEETPPIVLDATEQAETAREILSQSLILTAEEGETWEIMPQVLAEMLNFNLVTTQEGVTYEVGLDPNSMLQILEPLAAQLDRPAANPRFIFNDDTGELDLMQPGVIGRSLDMETSLQRIQTDLKQGLHEIPLSFKIIEPEVEDTATAQELQISEPVSVVTSYFSGSDPARAQNIKTAASAFHGLLVAPGETLSMAEVLGDISLDTGYAEALIIFGDRTIKGVGGGVCQVSTTLFRAAFFGGYPIVERHPHAYRVGYYELGSSSPGPGLDATVFVPTVDFKFANDRPYWLLLETYIYGSQFLWKFYSTSDGREVEWSKAESNEVEAPKPLYTKNPDLPKGEIRQVDWAADGLDVVVYRTVTMNGEVLLEDTIQTHYLPWRAIYEYGPGTELPEDAKTE
jgi:vancomycin resistance protein YoaR